MLYFQFQDTLESTKLIWGCGKLLYVTDVADRAIVTLDRWLFLALASGQFVQHGGHHYSYNYSKVTEENSRMVSVSRRYTNW